MPTLNVRPSNKAIVSWRRVLPGAAALFCLGCEAVEPYVVIVNRTAEHVLIANLTYNGTIWNTVLAFGESSAPLSCMTGTGQVHFRKYDAYSYCRDQVQYGLIDSLCMCDSAWISVDTSVISATPIWYNYRTIEKHTTGYNDFLIVEITLEGMEQDFSAPGPYGH